jgi:hypothetical protein
MKQKHLVLDKNSMIEIDGQFYIAESKISELVGKQEVLPVYFALTKTSKVYHDSPVIGDEEFGPWEQDCFKGPFFDLEEANAVLQEREEQTNKVSYEFHGKVIKKAYPLENGMPSEMPVYRYYAEGCSLWQGQGPRNSWFPKYNVSSEQVQKFYEEIEQRTRQRAKEIKEDGKLLAIIEREGTCILELELKNNMFSLHTFSNCRQYLNFSADLDEHGIDYRAFKKDPVTEMLSFSPVTFSLKSIGDIIKEHDLIF